MKVILPNVTPWSSRRVWSAIASTTDRHRGRVAVLAGSWIPSRRGGAEWVLSVGTSSRASLMCPLQCSVDVEVLTTSRTSIPSGCAASVSTKACCDHTATTGTSDAGQRAAICWMISRSCPSPSGAGICWRRCVDGGSTWSSPTRLAPAATQDPVRYRMARCWDGGRDGRLLLDGLCAGLPDVLTDDGTALVVHSEVCGEHATASIATMEAVGLDASVIARAEPRVGRRVRHPRQHAIGGAVRRPFAERVGEWSYLAAARPARWAEAQAKPAETRVSMNSGPTARRLPSVMQPISVFRAALNDDQRRKATVRR